MELETKEKKLASKFDSIISLMEKEKMLYDKLISCSFEEREYIKNDEADKLRLSILKKDKILDEILQVEIENTELKIVFASASHLFTDKEKVKISKLIDDLKDLTLSLEKLHTENSSILEEKNTKNQEKLQHVKQGRSLHKAYSVYGNSIPDTRRMNKLS